MVRRFVWGSRPKVCPANVHASRGRGGGHNSNKKQGNYALENNKKHSFPPTKKIVEFKNHNTCDHSFGQHYQKVPFVFFLTHDFLKHLVSFQGKIILRNWGIQRFRKISYFFRDISLDFFLKKTSLRFFAVKKVNFAQLSSRIYTKNWIPLTQSLTPTTLLMYASRNTVYWYNIHPFCQNIFIPSSTTLLFFLN